MTAERLRHSLAINTIEIPPISRTVDQSLWCAVSVAFVALGINKQLDLQTALTELGRVFAASEGWYEQRQIVRFWFIIAVGATCLLLALILLILARRAPLTPLPTWVALIGLVAVLAFVAIRAASFHHFDRFIGNRVLGLKWNCADVIGGA